MHVYLPVKLYFYYFIYIRYININLCNFILNMHLPFKFQSVTLFSEWKFYPFSAANPPDWVHIFASLGSSYYYAHLHSIIQQVLSMFIKNEFVPSWMFDWAIFNKTDFSFSNPSLLLNYIWYWSLTQHFKMRIFVFIEKYLRI